MDEKRKKSLFRYIAIMFVVAFVLVLISLVGQTRSIGHLSESSASALQRAEELQNTNRDLTEQIAELQAQLEILKDENETLQSENDALRKENREQIDENDALQSELDALTQELQTMKEGNEQ
ncbi:MAG: hypothetical protein IJO88_01795 [Oscillospiraceae bacterium]|nr:hypothetical protein [Oscillospiraceae bacterium]